MTVMMKVTNKPLILSVINAECHYTECHYAECRGTFTKSQMNIFGHFKHGSMFTFARNKLECLSNANFSRVV